MLHPAQALLLAWKALLSRLQAQWTSLTPHHGTASVPVHASITDIYHTAPRLSTFLFVSLDCELLEDRGCVWFICDPGDRCIAPDIVVTINEWMDDSPGAHLLSTAKSTLLALFPTTLLTAKTSHIFSLQNQLKTGAPSSFKAILFLYYFLQLPNCPQRVYF